MIISHEHRFIFVKTRKTAGTSIEVLLSSLIEPDAIVTPIEPPVEGHHPRNFERPDSLVATVRNRRNVHARNDLARDRWFHNHIPARMIRERLGKRRFESYYKFAFERDPWDKVVSWFYFRTRNGDTDLGFEEWIQREHLPRDWGKYTIDDEIAVDFVGRFEHLASDLATALAAVGLDASGSLTREKGNLRPVAAATPVTHTEATIARIAEVFHREIAQFGYVAPSLDIDARGNGR